MTLPMANLRISVGGFGLSMLTMLSSLGCGGAVEAGDASGRGGRGGAGRDGGGGGPGGGGPVTPLGGSGSGGGSPGGTAAGGALTTFSCTPVETNLGFVTCNEGFTHRVEAVDCPAPAPRATTCIGTDGTSGCSVDSDCTAGTNGYCELSSYSSYCYCNYGCLKDSDCGAGQICQCGDPVGRCVMADCTSDAECNGGACATYDSNPGCGGVAYACTVAGDSCLAGSDCPDGYCSLDAVGFRVCASASCVIGRPFLVAGEDRRATIAGRCDWIESVDGSVFDGMSREQRARLGQHYTQIAQMEHAAVAAFARLLLELIGRAAPAELIERVVEAQRDETRHAKLAFGLASQLLGKAIGPGPLELSGAKLGASLEELAYNTVVEGCVGETIASLEAAEAQERAGNETIRELFVTIAADEARHAQLSWRVVAWLLEFDAPGLRAIVVQAFDDAKAQSAPDRITMPEDEAHGALSNETAAELRRQTWCQVLTPCRERLLGYSKRNASDHQHRGANAEG